MTRAARTRSGRRPLARHGRLRTPRPLARILSLLAVGVAVVVVSATGVVGFTAWSLAAGLAGHAVELEGQDELQLPPALGAYEGPIDLLVVGTDVCEPEYAEYFPGRCTGPDADSEGELNDVNILVHISDQPRRVTAVTFPRDLMIPIPSCTDPETGVTSSAMSKQPLNDAWSYGGLSCVVKTVSQLSGVSIPFAAKITWGGVMELADAVGGVDVCVAERIYDPDNTGIDLSPGMHHLEGVWAVEFLRVRHGLGDGSDLSRISNQQQFLSSLTRKIVNGGVLSDVPALLKLATTAVENITPSQSLADPLRLVQLALAAKGVSFDDIVFVQYPTFPDPDDPDAKVVPNEDAADALWAALAANQPLQLTGDAAVGGGVVRDPTEPAEPSPVPGDDAASPEPRAELPSAITGSTAADPTCSVGQG